MVNMKFGWLLMPSLLMAGPLLGGAEMPAAEKPWNAGVARANITPGQPMLMAGFAKRTGPAEGKETDLWLKALALRDSAGNRVVIVTADLLAIRAPLYRRCLPRLKEKFGLEAHQVLLTASHTHCGPLLPTRPESLDALGAAQRVLVEEYSARLEDTIIETTGRALAGLAPVRLASVQGRAGFAANRRNNSARDAEKLIQEGALAGPVDHSVPVLAAYRPDGSLFAVLFGYACHNTTLEDYKWNGDYAGYAQSALERSHPGATAMFFMGCGGDQDPLPRVQFHLAERFGNMLAAAVEEALLATPASLAPTLKTAMATLTLNLGAAPTEAELERLKRDETPFVRRWATRLLSDLQAGKSLERTHPYPIQAWRFGDSQLLITLGGEPVVDYALKFKREFGPQTWVAGYGNEVMAYIPSLRVLNEDKPPRASVRWGYEGSQSMQVLGLPAWRWGDDVEELITDGVRGLVNQVSAP
jgi:hypothetical protein